MDKEIEISSLPLTTAGRARGGRATQQDELICLHDAGTGVRLLVLADGMGGDGAGELAAQGVIHVTRLLWQQRHWQDQPAALFLETLCQEAHAELRRRGDGLTEGAPHSTVVALLIRDDRAAWAHVGDSRLYHFEGRRCLNRTEDHSLAQLKVDRGELEPEALAADPDQHKLLRGLGGPEPPRVDHGGARLRSGQCFVLCSDGVWGHLSTQELGHLSHRPDQDGALREALVLAVERGGDDGDNAALIFARCNERGWLQRWRNKLRAATRNEAVAVHADKTVQRTVARSLCNS